ncbi:MAG: leucine-rich repeat domain-containing protein [Bacteroidales bacterium]|nr:leucine-rich repeat domain-containing protein [Bacteroidales bacterium]
MHIVDKYNIGNNVTKIPNGAFIECNITDIILPNSLENIGDNAFAYCRHLTGINIPNSVISIGERAFEGCDALSELSIGESVSTIGNFAFVNSNLSTINFNAINCISMGTQEEPVFAQLQNPGQNINIGNRVTIIPDYAFKGCNAPSLTIPDSVSIIGESAFEFCGFSSLTIGNNVTSIGSYAFFNSGIFTLNYNATNCTSIGEYNGITENTNTYVLIIGENVETIPSGLFRGCTGLTEITIPNSVTSIGENTFYGCNELTVITIGSSAENIGESAFDDCDNISNINIFAEIPPTLDNNVFTETTYNSATLWVPCRTASVYRNDDKWGQFTDIRNDNTTLFSIVALTADYDMGSVTGEGEYSCETDVTINAIPNNGFRFVFWNDGNTDNPRTITVISDSTFVANFEEIPTYIITTLSNDNEYGSVSGSGTYEENSEAILTAIPNQGYCFTSWDDENTDNPRTIIVTSDRTFIANFSETIHYVIDTTATKYLTIGDRTFYVAGQYSFTISSEEGCDTIVDLNLRILDEPEAYDISPNPAKSVISISSEDYISYVEFYTTTGRPVMQKEINAKQAEINVEKFAPGIYFVRLYGEDGIAPTVQRFVKE